MSFLKQIFRLSITTHFFNKSRTKSLVITIVWQQIIYIFNLQQQPKAYLWFCHELCSSFYIFLCKNVSPVPNPGILILTYQNLPNPYLGMVLHKCQLFCQSVLEKNIFKNYLFIFLCKKKSTPLWPHWERKRDRERGSTFF